MSEIRVTDIVGENGTAYVNDVVLLYSSGVYTTS